MIQKHLLVLFVTLFLSGLTYAGEDSIKSTQPEPASAIKVVFETTMGAFTLALDSEKAPATVENFLRYVDAGFYDDTLFHRVIPNFMAQGGGYTTGLDPKYPFYPSVDNESANGLRNVRGSVSMARRSDPDSATSQFFVNVVHNSSLDSNTDRPGYTAFGKVVDGMRVVDNIVAVETTAVDGLRDVPREDVVILSARRKTSAAMKISATSRPEPFLADVHYKVLDTPVPTADESKVEVVQAFAYGCPNCFAFDSIASEWRGRQTGDVSFKRFPAVWNEPMRLFAQAFYSAESLGVADRIHLPLYNALLVHQQKLTNQDEMATWFAGQGVESSDFLEAFNSRAVKEKVRWAEEQTRTYRLGDVPQLVVNGKYTVDAMRAGGHPQMLAVVAYLIDKEREELPQ